MFMSPNVVVTVVSWMTLLVRHSPSRGQRSFFSAIALSQGQVTVAYFLIRQVRLRQLKAGVDLPHKISGLIKEKEREPGYFDLIKRQIKNT